MPPSRWIPRLPSLCAVCRGWGASRLCPACLRRFAAPVPRCGRCALPVPAGVPACGQCLAAPPPHDHAVAAVNYAFPWDRLLLDFKFHGALDLTHTLVQRLQAAVDLSTTPAPDLLLPVPVAAARLHERGFNQAWELARRLGPRAEAALLLRVRHTPHQIALPHAERAANVRGAFALEPRRVAALEGLHVAIVDDVMTTGATAREITRVLRAARVGTVSVWVVARTPAPSG